MTCTFCRRRIHKTDEGFWSDGQRYPTFCGFNPTNTGQRFHEPEAKPQPLISWYSIDQAFSASSKVEAWPRVLERLRSAERAAFVFFLMVMFLAAMYLTDLIGRIHHHGL